MSYLPGARPSSSLNEFTTKVPSSATLPVAVRSVNPEATSTGMNDMLPGAGRASPPNLPRPCTRTRPRAPRLPPNATTAKRQKETLVRIRIISPSLSQVRKLEAFSIQWEAVQLVLFKSDNFASAARSQSVPGALVDRLLDEPHAAVDQQHVRAA